MEDSLWPWQCSPSFPTTLPSLLFVKFMRGSLACPSLKWNISQTGKEINLAHLDRKAEMGSTLNHSSWQDHASRWHFRNLQKNFRPSCGIMSVSSIFSCPTLGQPSTCYPRGQTQTDRHRGDSQKGRSGEECVAMLMQLWLSDTTVTLASPPGSVRSGGSWQIFLTSTGNLYFPHYWKLDSGHLLLSCAVLFCY